MPSPLVLALADADMGLIAPVMQSGFQVRVPTGVSLRHLFTCQWGLSEDFIESRISTIFVNGKPADDLDRTVVRDGITLALSSAMPGLVGATMRRGGVVAAFRSGITHKESAAEKESGTGAITVKLFNLLIPELGPLFLAQGVFIEANRLPEPLRQLLPDPCTASPIQLISGKEAPGVGIEPAP